MKWSAAANRGKVGKGIGAQIKSGEIGAVGASEKISAFLRRFLGLGWV